MKYFRELNTKILEGKTVILDIDGTISFDAEHDVDGKEKDKLDELKKVAKVILVSNGERDRTKKIAQINDVLAHVSEYQKPNKKVLSHIEKSDAVIVGDKFLTDGLLALQTGIPFLHVKSLKRKNESWKLKLIYFVDDILGYAFESLRLIRPKQWVKNLLVFAPAFFAGTIFDLSVLFSCVLAFLTFCLSSSLIYIYNDLKDAQDDRLHHKKKWRPIASFNISIFDANILFIIIFLFLLGFISFVPQIIPIIAIYVFSNILYTLKLKKVPIFDVVIVASMYVMRVVAGGLACKLFISPWIIACTFFASLFIISCKRYIEFQNPVRSVLKRYTRESLQGLLIISSGLTLISYVLYTIMGSHIEHILYTSVFVIAIVLVMLNDVLLGDKKIESPEIYLLTNRHIRYIVLAYVVFMYILLYQVNLISKIFTF